MWKRLDEAISLSEKLASLSWLAIGTWTYVVAQTDTMGRFPRDARIVKAKCMTMRYEVRLEQVEEALLEIEKAGLLHRYDVDGKSFLVLHNATKYNPPGALGHVSPKYPEPPKHLCKCLEGQRANGARTPDVTSSSCLSSLSSEEDVEPIAPNKSTPAGLLASAYCAKNKGVIAYEKCINLCQFFLDGGGKFQEAEAAILNSKGGEKVWEILDPLRPKKTKAIGDAAFAPAKTKCQNCGGTGKIAGAVSGGAIQLIPCNACSSSRKKAVAQ